MATAPELFRKDSGGGGVVAQVLRAEGYIAEGSGWQIPWIRGVISC